MTDRFDLEQDILRCWTIVDDLKKFSQQTASSDQYQALAVTYDVHFECLWKTFETMLRDGKIA